MTSPTPWELDQVVMKEMNASNKINSQCIYNEALQKYSYHNLNSDKPFLREIDSYLTNLWERAISEIAVSHLSTNENTQDVLGRRTFVSKDRHADIIAETLAENFCIVNNRSKVTLRAATQRGTRSAILPIAIRNRVDRMFDVPRLRSRSHSLISPNQVRHYSIQFNTDRER